MELKDKVPSLVARAAKLEVCWNQRDSRDTFKNTMEQSCRPAAPKNCLREVYKDIPLNTVNSVNRMKKVSAMETDN